MKMHEYIAAAVVSAFLSANALTAQTVVSTSDDRESLGLTLYTGGIALVREVRTIDLPGATATIQIQDVSGSLMPETVIQRALGDRMLDLMEQRYRYDQLTVDQLLEHYVGREVFLLREDPSTGLDRALPAEVVSTVGGVVLRIEGQLVSGYPGRFAFPDMPEGLVTSPTLEWQVRGGRGSHTIELSYLSRGMSWTTDYVLALNGEGEADITAWASLANTSGVAYKNADIKVVAGNVRLVSDQGRRFNDLAMEAARADMGLATSLGDYYVYTLERPTTLANNETKQLSLFSRLAMSVEQRYVAASTPGIFRNNLRLSGNVDTQVESKLRFVNSDATGPGVPLPAGIVRVYRPDDDGDLQFVGEDRIGHTPVDESVEVTVGTAFDLIVQRQQTDFTQMGRCASSSSWSIRVANRGDEDATIELLENSGGDWTISEATHDYDSVDARTFVFPVTLGAGEETSVSYTLRLTWC